MIERAMERDEGCGAVLHLVAGFEAVVGLTNELVDLTHHVLTEEGADAPREAAKELSAA